MKVPFADLRLQYEELRDEIDTAIRTVIENSTFIGGKPVKDFASKRRG
jgi:dTDP-4-amino-4,6-dideoxygalactose transaminase